MHPYLYFCLYYLPRGHHHSPLYPTLPRTATHQGPLHHEVDLLSLLPLRALPHRDLVLEGDKEVCGVQLHTTRVTSQFQPAQSAHVDGRGHKAHGLS